MEFVELEVLPKISWSYQEFGRHGIPLKYNYHLCAVPLKQRETVVAVMDFAFSVFNQHAGLAETSQNSGFWGFFGV